MATPGVSGVNLEPGTPHWWLARLAGRLMERQAIFDIRESWADGPHPAPNGDRRYVKALRDFQNKAQTNYISLVQQAVTQKMRVKYLTFGPSGSADSDAAEIMQANSLDYQFQTIIQNAAKFGFAYAIVLPSEEGGPPNIFYRDPRMCEVERDRNRPTETLAGLEYWIEEATDRAFAILYLPDAIYRFEASSPAPGLLEDIFRGGVASMISNFEIMTVEENPIGKVPLERCDWVPSAGEKGRASGEEAWAVQDRINKTILDRLIISNSQAYKQRWVTGAPKINRTSAGKGAPPWDPGSDMIWLSMDPNTKFGEFNEADIGQILEAVRDDVGDLAAITQTPATFLVNRMVNVSGDTLLQANSGHTARVSLHQDAVAFFLEKIIRLAFAYIGNSKATELAGRVVWWPVETRPFSEVADAFQKLIASGIPIEIAMEFVGVFSNEQIEYTMRKAEEAKREADQQAREATQNGAVQRGRTSQASGQGPSPARRVVSNP